MGWGGEGVSTYLCITIYYQLGKKKVKLLPYILGYLMMLKEQWDQVVSEHVIKVTTYQVNQS